MMVEVLAAVMSGAAMTNDVHAWNTNPAQSGNVGHLFVAMDVSKMGSAKVFEERMEAMIGGIKASDKAVGTEEIFYPGEIELGKLANCVESGVVDIDDSTMEMFQETEKKLGL